MDTFGIGELARRTKVSPRSLRYYEEQGLLVPERNSAGHRVYQPQAVACVEFIQRLFAAGVPSGLVRTLVRGWREPDGPDRVRAMLRGHHAAMAADITRRQAELRRLEALMDLPITPV